MAPRDSRTVGFYWQPAGDDHQRALALLDETGANAVFVSYRALAQAPIAELRRRGLRLYVDWTIFAGEDLRAAFPDSVPMDAAGNAFERDGWYVPACPTHPQLRARHLEAMAALLDRQGAQIDGLWLDFIRFPIRWEGAQPPLAQHCFCPRCLSLFLGEERDYMTPAEARALAETILQTRPDEWVEWKCTVIAQFVQAVRGAITARGLPVQLGIFSLPWRRADYDGAIRAIAGQDLGRLAADVDFFSPMVYHWLCHRPAAWVAAVVEDVQQWTGRPVLPIVQSIDRPDPMPPEELDAALASALGASTAGAMIFTLDPLLESAAKATVARRWFRAA